MYFISRAFLKQYIIFAKLNETEVLLLLENINWVTIYYSKTNTFQAEIGN